MGICASSQATTAYDGASVGIHKSTITQTTVNTSSEQKRSTLTASAEQIERMLDVIEHEIFPKTQKSVTEDGNKVFGAAILSKDFETTIVADTNHEMDCPLYHGEIYAIYQMSKIVPADKRGDVAAESIFVSTHEPCCMCISSIVWAGFQKVYYLFPYEATTAQGIPHDVNIMNELWGARYREENQFCSSSCIIELCMRVKDDEVREKLRQRIKQITIRYDELSKTYHTEKVDNEQNNLVFG